MAIGAIILSTLAIGQMLVWTAVEAASADAPAGTSLTFTELGKGSTFKHIRNTKTKNQRSNLWATSSSSRARSPTVPARRRPASTSSASRRSARATS